MTPFNIFLLIIDALAIVMAFKNYVTFKNRNIIMDAIHDYNTEQIISFGGLFPKDATDFEVIENHLTSLKFRMISYDNIEPYFVTLLRLWDWGYTRLLPPEKFELVKPYIKKGGVEE